MLLERMIVGILVQSKKTRKIKLKFNFDSDSDSDSNSEEETSKINKESIKIGNFIY